jgi:hypothetical protein
VILFDDLRDSSLDVDVKVSPGKTGVQFFGKVFGLDLSGQQVHIIGKEQVAFGRCQDKWIDLHSTLGVLGIQS